MTTLPQLLVERARRTPHAVAFRAKRGGIWRETSWVAYLRRVQAFALGLAELGIGHGDQVAIVGDNGAEWFVAELAVQALGGASVGILPDASASELQAVVEHAEVRCVVVEDQEQVDKVLGVKSRLPKLEHVVFWNPKGLRTYDQPFLRRFDHVEAQGAEQPAERFEHLIRSACDHDVAVLVYSNARSAMLSHVTLVAAVDNLLAIDPIHAGDNYLSFLPAASVMEQTLGLTASLRSGQVLNFPESPETVPQDLREIGPRMMLAEPATWEAIAAQLEAKSRAAGLIKRNVFQWGMRERSAQQWLQCALAERLVRAPVRDQLGLTRLRRAYALGAVDEPALHFFRALGVNVQQAYEPQVTARLHTIGASHGLLVAA